MSSKTTYSPPGDFKSTNVTMKGVPYKMIAVERRESSPGRFKFYCTLKNAAGQTKEFEHNELMGMVDKCCLGRTG